MAGNYIIPLDLGDTSADKSLYLAEAAKAGFEIEIGEKVLL